jgi:hypothetical protein
MGIQITGLMARYAIFTFIFNGLLLLTDFRRSVSTAKYSPFQLDDEEPSCLPPPFRGRPPAPFGFTWSLL